MAKTILLILPLVAAAFRVQHGHESVLPKSNSTESTDSTESTESTESTDMAGEAQDAKSLPILSRKRRYIVFPKGSSIQYVVCENIRHYTPLTQKFRLGITLGLAWMLPASAHELYLQKRDLDAVALASAAAGFGLHHRADMYKVLETFLSIRGLKGRECIMRAVCEASESKQTENNATSTADELRQGTFMEELHKLLFALPDHPKHKTIYDEAKQHAGKCGESYPGCHSFLNLEV